MHVMTQLYVASGNIIKTSYHMFVIGLSCLGLGDDRREPSLEIAAEEHLRRAYAGGPLRPEVSVLQSAVSACRSGDCRIQVHLSLPGLLRPEAVRRGKPLAMEWGQCVNSGSEIGAASPPWNSYW